MKKIFTTEFKVGLTVIVSTLILILGIIWGKGYRLHTNKYHLQIVFENVGGMVPGDPVTVNGVKEGKVLKIDWLGRQVLCTIELNDKVQLYEDATFTVISAELLAGMKIEIFPGKSNKKINLSRQPFHGKYGGRIVDVGLVIGEMAEDMSRLTYRLDTTIVMINTMLAKGELQQKVSQSLDNVDKITSGLLTTPARLNHTILVLDSTVVGLKKLLNRNDRNFQSTLNNLNRVTAKLDTATVSLKNVLARIDKNQGTVGKMLSDTTLYINMNRAILRLDSLAKQVKDEGLNLDLF